jgi:hypothetical protein
MAYKIIRSKRKTISLIINDTADLIVRAPMRITNEYVLELIVKKQK